MPKRKRDRLKAVVARGASRVATRLRDRRGIVGRAVRALDDELNVAYLADIAESEDDLIDRFRGPPMASEDLKVSIVVPTHGVALAYVKELVTSLEEQTYGNWELCVADDADPEVEVAAHLSGLARERPDRFKYRRLPENRGISGATREGLSLVTGDLVAFVDADDLLHPRALEVIASRFAADERVDFLYTDHDSTTDLGFRRRPIRKPGASPELLQSVNYVNHLVVVRKDCLDRCEGAFAPDISGGQDWDLCYRLMAEARRVTHVPLTLYHWRGRPGSVADNMHAKPWVHDACLVVRQRFLDGLDPRLTVIRDDAEHGYHYETGFKEDAEKPRILAVGLAPSSARKATPPAVPYDGWLQSKLFRYDANATNADFLAAFAELAADLPDGLVLFLDARRPAPTGDLSRMAAYAIQPKVGGVWPFHGPAVRFSYTLDDQPDRLRPTDTPVGMFTRFTGNVLTGPLHGMLTRGENVRAALEHVSRLDGVDFGFRDKDVHLDTIGAMLGLAFLRDRLRNVGCRGMRCEVALDTAFPPRSFIPASDPWG